MAGGGIQNTNVFAALDSLKKKKRSDKTKDATGRSKETESEPAVFWAPAPLNVKSWADVDDDDDYYATAAPPEKMWGLEETKEEALLDEEEVSESEVDGTDDGTVDTDVEESDHEAELEPVLKKPPSAPVAKDTERQLSKKELKKKELAELEAVLAELGLSAKDENKGTTELKEPCEEQPVNAAGQTESKTSKKKKAKKDKSSKVVKDSQEQSNLADAKVLDDKSEPAEEEESAVDVKERLKKMALKKKKSGKESTAPKAVKDELAARRAKLEATKKKEKSHYNQQPVR